MTMMELALSYMFAVYFNVGYVVLENGWHVDFWKLIFAKYDQQACLTAGAIAHNDQLFSYCCHYFYLLFIYLLYIYIYIYMNDDDIALLLINRLL